MAQVGEYSSLDTEDDMTTCAVCMEEYEDPRALPCLHTFCLKCLMEVSMGGGEGERPSDVSLQVTALKLEFASYMPTAPSIPKQQDTLKCPMCSEEHPIPKEKGVAGFRKDFRINKMLDQKKSKGDGDAVFRSISQEDVEAPPETCPFHQTQKLMYHCETCRADVCQDCWGSTHDDHVVKLLSKKVNDAKSTLKQQMETNISKILTQVDALKKAKESLTSENESIEINIQKRFADIQQKLQHSFQQTSQEFEMNRKLQEKKMSDEIQNLTNLRDTFAQIKEGVERENPAQTSKVYRNYVNLQEKMQQMGEELSQWSFEYKTAQLEVSVPNEEFFKIIGVNYQEETLGQKTEGGKKLRGGRLRDGKKGPKPGKKEKADKGPKQAKKKEDKLEGAVTKSPSHVQTSGMNLKWEHFVVQKKPNIECITATKSNDLFVATNEKFSGFKTSPPKAFFEVDLQGESVDAIVMAISKAGSTDFLVKLDMKRKVLKFLSSKGKSNPYDYVSKFHRVEQESQKLLASYGHFVCYAYTDQQKVCVAFLTIDDETPTLSEFGVPIQVQFDKVRSMCMYISQKGNPVLVCGNAFHAGKTDKSDLAIVAMTKQIVHWKVTFDDLDPDASVFDLRDMACDKDNVFILNNRAHVVYHISKNGSCVRKVSIVDTPPKYHFSSPTSICLDQRTKSVYIAHAKDIISKFSY